MGNRKTSRLLAFFQHLSADLEYASHSSDPTLAYAVLRQLERMKKKAKLGNANLAEVAKKKFLENNASLEGFQVKLPDEVVAVAREFISDAMMRHCKKECPDSLQEHVTWEQLMNNWSFGPGASNGVAGTGTCSKIDQPMSCTPSAYPYVRNLRLHDTYFRCFDASRGSDGTTMAYGSRLECVPKNELTDRTIAIEPSGNMALQLAVGRVIEGALRRIGLDIRSQQFRNRALARLGSLLDNLATIDMSMASDRILPDLVRLLWPADLCKLFFALRSEYTEVDGVNVRLNMISTMGNGFTFPLMTMTILALIHANRVCSSATTLNKWYGRRPSRGDVLIDWSVTAVFGDDIIVPVYEYESLCDLLEKAGFAINHDKSFHSGPFRESCGGDYYKGRFVTPFYVKSLRTTREIYVAINQLLGWLGEHALFAPTALRYLIGLVDEPLFVPEWLGDTAGIRTMGCGKKYTFLRSKPFLLPFGGWSTMRLACGGYLSTQGTDYAYGSPRPNEKEVEMLYEVAEARLPSGYLDGWDPLSRSLKVSSHVQMLLSMLR